MGAGSGPVSGFGAGRPGDDGSVDRTAGPAGGAWCRWDAGSACAMADRSPGDAVLDVAGVWGFGPSVGLLAWGCTVSEGRVVVASVGVAAHACVEGSSGSAFAGPAVGRSGVPWRGDGAPVGPVSPLPGWLPAADRVWTRRVVFGVAGSGPCAGVRCQGVARVGCPPPPYSWGSARLRSRQVTPGVPGSLWPRGVVMGVVVPPVWTHALVGRSVACRPSMVPECPGSAWRRQRAVGVVW